MTTGTFCNYMPILIVAVGLVIVTAIVAYEWGRHNSEDYIMDTWR